MPYADTGYDLTILTRASVSGEGPRGPAVIAASALNGHDRLLFSEGGPIGVASPAAAELEAALLGLSLARQHGGRVVCHLVTSAETYDLLTAEPAVHPDPGVSLLRGRYEALKGQFERVRVMHRAAPDLPLNAPDDLAEFLRAKRQEHDNGVIDP